MESGNNLTIEETATSHHRHPPSFILTLQCWHDEGLGQGAVSVVVGVACVGMLVDVVCPHHVKIRPAAIETKVK